MTTTNLTGDGSLGVGALLWAVALIGAAVSWFAPLDFLPYLTAAVVILAGADFILYQAQMWKMVTVAGITLVAWCSAWVLPVDLLTNASPFERVKFRLENPAVAAAADKLGEYVQVGGYELRIIDGYNLSDSQRQPESSAWVYTGPRRADGGAGMVALVELPVSAVSAAQLDKLSFAQLVRRRVLPELVGTFDLPEIVQQDGALLDINGLSFYKVAWAGVTKATAQAPSAKVRGVIYVCRDPRTHRIVACLSFDQDPYARSAAPAVEAAAYTIRAL